MAVVFVSFLVIGMALPVLPLHVHDILRFGPFMVGVVSGCQFVAALVSRLWAGRLADTRGSKHAVVLGLWTSVAGGAFYLLSVLLLDAPDISVAAILVGRTLLGGGESLIITGGLTWGLRLVAAESAGKVIAWVGMALFAAMAIGAPIGSAIYARLSFSGIAVATIVLPCAALLVVRRVRAFIPAATHRARVGAVLRAVMLPGLGFALSGITFGAMTSFLTLHFSVHGWKQGAFAFSAFAVALILVRVFFGDLADRYGGARVALYCFIIQAGGLLMIGTANVAWLATLGAVVTGAGFSLVFSSLGIEAVRRVPVASRGVAMGTYNAFLDVTLGFASPALGLLAAKLGLGAVFIGSAVTALLAMPVVLRLRVSSNAPSAL